MTPKSKLGDWREKTLDRIRAVILEADPEMIEERKWKKPSNGMIGVPVWSHDGIVCTGETYKDYVKMTFAKGAFVKDPSGLFNSSLEGNLRRAIDIHQGDRINEKALKALIKAAVKLNEAPLRLPLAMLATTAGQASRDLHDLIPRPRARASRQPQGPSGAAWESRR